MKELLNTVCLTFESSRTGGPVTLCLLINRNAERSLIKEKTVFKLFNCFSEAGDLFCAELATQRNLENKRIRFLIVKKFDDDKLARPRLSKMCREKIDALCYEYRSCLTDYGIQAYKRKVFQIDGLIGKDFIDNLQITDRPIEQLTQRYSLFGCHFGIILATPEFCYKPEDADEIANMEYTSNDDITTPVTPITASYAAAAATANALDEENADTLIGRCY